MINIFNLFKKKPDPIKEAIDNARWKKTVAIDQQKTEIMKINRSLKLLLDEGSIEITIKNVKGVLENE